MKLGVAVATADALPSAFVVFRDDLCRCIDRCAALGFHGVELALLDAAQADVPRIRERLRATGMEIPCVSSGQVFAKDRAIEADRLEAWRVTAADWGRHKKYDRYVAVAEEMLELTESEFAPWTIVEATSKWYARKKIFETIVGALEKRLGANAPPRIDAPAAAAKDAELRAAMESLGAENSDAGNA